MSHVKRSASVGVCAAMAALVMFSTGDRSIQAQTGQPVLLLAGTTNGIGFGRTGLGVTSTPQVVMFQNGGTADLVVAGISVQGANPGDFSVLSSTCGSVAPSGFCLVTMAFQPSANGVREARLTVVNNAPGSPHTIPVLGTGVDPSQPQSAVGPTDPRFGFPISFSDGVSNLELCLGHETGDPTIDSLPPGSGLGTPLCLEPVPDPTQPPSVTDTTVNFGGEAFWWSAEASIEAASGAQALLVMAQEAAFQTETPAVGEQVAFGRIRIRMRRDGVPANAWFRFTHPFGVDEYLAEPDLPGDPGEIFETSDIGCFSAPCDFSQALPGNTRISRFLTCVAPTPPAGYVGNPSELCTVTGSPTGFNAFRVEQITGPGGDVVALVGETNLFAVSGKLAASLPAPPPPPPATVLVPDVVGQLQSAAEGAIGAAGLTLGPVTTEVNAAPVNTVIAQSPAAGSSVAQATAVALTVSLGPAVNAAPVAGDDALATTGPLTFTAASLLANDTDADGNALAITAVAATGTGGGAIAGDGAGSWTYTPLSGFAGVDTFTYTVSDGQASDIGTVSVTVTAPPPPPPPAPVGLVLALGFDETAGTLAADSSGGGLDGTVLEAAFVAGKYGNALAFDGVNDWVTVPDSAALDLTNGLTIEAWVLPAALSGWETLVLKEHGTEDMAYGLYAHDGAPLAGGVAAPAGTINNGAGHHAVRGPSALPNGVWTHVATTYDGSTQRFYVNGALVASRAQTGSMPAAAGVLRIGGNSSWAGEFFEGLIDEVRIYNRALSAAEVQADMNAPIR